VTSLLLQAVLLPQPRDSSSVLPCCWKKSSQVLNLSYGISQSYSSKPRCLWSTGPGIRRHCPGGRWGGGDASSRGLPAGEAAEHALWTKI